MPVRAAVRGLWTQPGQAHGPCTTGRVRRPRRARSSSPHPRWRPGFATTDRRERRASPPLAGRVAPPNTRSSRARRSVRGVAGERRARRDREHVANHRGVHVQVFDSAKSLGVIRVTVARQHRARREVHSVERELRVRHLGHERRRRHFFDRQLRRALVHADRLQPWTTLTVGAFRRDHDEHVRCRRHGAPALASVRRAHRRRVRADYG